MTRRILSQVGNVGIASNPANGVNNIPMSGGEGMSSGITPDEALKILYKVQNASPQEALQQKIAIEDCLNRVTQPQMRTRFEQILNALVITQDPKPQNPKTP